MDDMTAPGPEAKSFWSPPLVASCSHKPCLLHVSGWANGPNKKIQKVALVDILLLLSDLHWSLDIWVKSPLGAWKMPGPKCSYVPVSQNVFRKGRHRLVFNVNSNNPKTNSEGESNPVLATFELWCFKCLLKNQLDNFSATVRLSAARLCNV